MEDEALYGLSRDDVGVLLRSCLRTPVPGAATDRRAENLVARLTNWFHHARPGQPGGRLEEGKDRGPRGPLDR